MATNRLFHANSELRILRTLTETDNKRIAGQIFAAVDPDSFHTDPCKEIFNLVKSHANKKATILKWDDLKHNLKLSKTTREKIRSYKRSSLKTKERVSRMLDRLHEFRQSRLMYYMARNVSRKLDGKTINPEELLEESSNFITKARTNSDTSRWITNIGVKNDRSGDILLKKTLKVTTKNYIPTGFTTYDRKSMGVPLGSFMLIATVTGGGKCLVGSSLVPTSKGLLSLKELWQMKGKNQGQGFYKLPNVKVISHTNNKKQASAIYKTKGKTWKIQTSTGDKLEGLPEHKLWTINDKSTFDFIEIDKLKVGQWLPKSNATGLFGNTQVSIEFAELLGLVVAEGKRAICMSINDVDMQRKIEKHIKKLFGSNQKFTKDNTLNFGKNISPLIKEHAGDVTSAYRYIPNSILTASKEVQCAFLRGYFEGDGAIWPEKSPEGYTRFHLEASSISKKLAYQIKSMLENIGIHSDVSYDEKFATNTEAKRRVPTWTVTVFRYEIPLFNDLIGFMSSRKIKEINKVKKHYNKPKIQNTTPEATGWINYLPANKPVKNLLSLIEKELTGLTYTHSYVNKKGTTVSYQRPYRLNGITNAKVINRTINKESLSRYIVQQLINDINNCAVSNILLKNKQIKKEIAIITNIMQYEWCQVTKSKSSNKEKTVYDLYVEDDHSYHVNGLIGHNTAMVGQLGEQMARAGAKICIVPLEMDGIEMMQRNLSRVANIPMTEILRAGELDKKIRRKIKKKYKIFQSRVRNNGGQLTYFVPEEDFTTEEILMILKPYGFQVIYIDYVGLTKGTDGDDQAKALGRATRYGKRFAKMTNTIVGVAAQLDSEFGRVRYSRAMVEHANVAWVWEFSENEINSGLIKVRQPKSRNQENFSFYLKHEFSHMRFNNLSIKEERQIERDEERQRQESQKGGSNNKTQGKPGGKPAKEPGKDFQTKAKKIQFFN